MLLHYMDCDINRSAAAHGGGGGGGLIYIPADAIESISINLNFSSLATTKL